MDEITPRSEKIDFNHPYTPYDVQEQFMRTAYDVLEAGHGRVGILESPTGTGKSLSLICASLTWLRKHKQAVLETSIETTTEAFKSEPSWVVDQVLKQKRQELTKNWEEREARLKRLRDREKSLEDRGIKKRRLDASFSHATSSAAQDEQQWLLDGGGDEDDTTNGDSSGLSKETKHLLGKLGMVSSKDDEDDDVIDKQVKIFYTSRTHSQLGQFIAELRRPIFPPSVPKAFLSEEARSETETVKHVPLSSRQRLCINPAVSRLGSVAAINDRCTELQQAKSKQKCQFVPNADNLAQTHRFRDNTLAMLPDIEDLFELGKKLSICPYYAARTAVPTAEIITLPYPLLLQKNARDALGIELEGNVVIIDEAHNIMDAVANVYSAEITLSELRRGRQMLSIYFKKFGKKLKGENRVMVAQVVRVVDGLSVWLEEASRVKGDQGVVDSNMLLKTKGIDQINLYRLIQYIQDSKLAYKIEGYAAHVEAEDTETAAAQSPTPVLHNLLSFLISLTNLSSEGRIFYHKILGLPQPDIKLSYLLLSPTHAFASVASSARAVILAGGTMSPFEDYTAHLFPNLQPDKITTLSCGHVIPASSICVWTLAAPRPGEKLEFEFSFQKRGDKAMIRELGVAILNICNVVPDGVVVFFPSYAYLDEVVSIWSENQSPAVSAKQETILSRIEARKALFRESKSISSDEILAQYTEAILGNTSVSGSHGVRRGALLLSVVGGKMSEGINFSDQLGRCVIIVGLPYPNINSPDWKARIEYIESTTTARITSTTPAMSKGEVAAKAKEAARDFYENACMRAVNQSIGRAIRHRGDYAAIILVDRRFATPRIRRKLPGWIQGGLVTGSEQGGVGQLMGALGKFFRAKKET